MSEVKNKIFHSRQPSLPRRDRQKSGPITYDETYDLIEDFMKNFEFYTHVEARVSKVYSEQEDLPLINLDGVLVPEWRKLQMIDCKLLHNDLEILEVRPLCSHFNCLPAKDEIVIVAEYNNAYYYSFPLATQGRVDYNRDVKVEGETRLVGPNTYANRPVMSSHGDTLIQGRYGHYIKFSGDKDEDGEQNIYPAITIGNNQNEDVRQNNLKDKNSKQPHFHNINSMGSTIHFNSSDEDINLIFSTEDGTEKDMGGNSISINSDKLFLNSKDGDIIISGKDDVTIASNVTTNIVSVGKINLGKANTQYGLVLGDNLIEMLRALFDNIKNYADKISNESANHKDAYDKLEMDIGELKKGFVNLLSKKVFTE